MRKTHSYNSGRINRADMLAEAGVPLQHAGGSDRPSGKKNKNQRSKKKTVITVIVSLFLVVVLSVGGVFGYLYFYLKSGLMDDSKIDIIDSSYYVPDEWDGKVLNIIVLGIDNDEERNFQDGDGLTDMVLFIHWDLTTNSMKMMQIPRDTYVGTDKSDNGRINGVLRKGGQSKDPDTAANPVNAVFDIFKNQYKLQAQHYISLDMDSLKEMVNAFGGLNVYVPKTMDDGKSRLEAGWRMLQGEEVEFFVRCRYGAGMERADMDRLVNQRYFYSALFRRLLTLTAGDLFKLMPVINKYFTTNFKITELVTLATKALTLDKKNVMFCRVPGAIPSDDGSEEWRPTNDPGHFIIDANGRGTEEEPGFAKLLNDHFRTFDESGAVLPDGLGLPNISIPSYMTLYPVEIISMEDVQEEEAPITEEDITPH